MSVHEPMGTAERRLSLLPLAEMAEIQAVKRAVPGLDVSWGRMPC